MKIKMKDAIHKKRKWRGWKGGEGGRSERKREERDLGTKKGRRGHTDRRELSEK